MSAVIHSLGLMLRWWWLNLCHLLVCAGISFLSRCIVSVTRLQVRLAKWSGLFLILITLSGCAHDVVRHAVTSESSITKAAAISDRIDDKAVIVQQWLKQN